MENVVNYKKLTIVSDDELKNVIGCNGIVDEIGEYLLEQIAKKSIQTYWMLLKLASENPHGIPQAYRR